MAELLSDGVILEQIRDDSERLLHRHYDHAHEWYPHEIIPWDEARSFNKDEVWDPQEYPLPDGVRSALYVHLLTEDNLPYYTNTILALAPRDHPLNEWTRRWTAEEARHSTVIRDWIIATRAFDPRLLEQGRLAQMAGGQVPEPPGLADMLAYTSFQEKATRVAHTNTGRSLGDERGGLQVMAKVAADEHLHYMFYKDLAGVVLEVDPSSMMIAICRQLRGFKMPGTGIPDFNTHEVAIAAAGIFNARQLLDMVVRPTLDAWKIEQIDGLEPKAESARKKIFQRLKALERIAA